MTNTIYKAETSKIFWCMVAQLIVGLLSGISTIVAIAGTVASIASEGKVGGSMALPIIIALAGIALNIVILMAYGKLQQDFGANTVDGASFGKLKIAAILALVSAAVSIIPVAGSIIAAICNIVVFILCMMAFSALKKSETFPGKDGAGTVYVSYILALIGAILSIIPVINIIGAILAIIALIMLLVGWAKIKNAPLPQEA